jgi:hypothetical protein
MFKEKGHGAFKGYCKGARPFMSWITCTLEGKRHVARAKYGTRVERDLTIEVIISLPQKRW